jgi:flagellar assembly factor FliW
MQIHTRRFGPIQFTLEEVLVLPDGLLDFPDEHRWLLLADRCHGDLYWLQSLDTPELAVAVIQPSLAGIAGFAALPRADWLDLIDQCDSDPVALVPLARGTSAATLDPDRPILINPIRRVGRQFQCRSLSSPPLADPVQTLPRAKAA